MKAVIWVHGYSFFELVSHYFRFHYKFENITHECFVSRGMKHQYETLVVVLFLNPVPIKTIRFLLQADHI